jgi:cell division inhibitor SepF
MLNSVMTFFGFCDDEDEPPTSALLQQTPQSTPTIHPMQHDAPKFEIRIAFPKTYDDSVNIATHLQQHRAVLVHLKYLDPSTSKRLIDFLCGTVYAMSGNMKKVSDQMFIFSAKNTLIEMAEDITDIERATQEYEGYKIENVAGL